MPCSFHPHEPHRLGALRTPRRERSPHPDRHRLSAPESRRRLQAHQYLLTNYLKELEKIDFEAFEKETARYNELTVLLSKAKTEEDLHAVLTSQYEALGIPLPYKEKTFDDFMENPSSRLEFK